MTKLFVYGTLMRGRVHHSLMTGAQHYGPAMTQPLYHLYDLGSYPALVRVAQNGDAIPGEVYTLLSCHLDELDDFEGVPHPYQRVPVELSNFPEDSPCEAYLWVAELPGVARRIAHWK